MRLTKQLKELLILQLDIMEGKKKLMLLIQKNLAEEAAKGG